MSSDPRVIVALDYDNAEDARRFADQVSPHSCKLKVGKELFTRCGPALVDELVKRGFDIFLDLKFHDIPNTTAKACLAAADMGVWMLNVHASGGMKMMEHAKQSLMAAGHNNTRLIGVTVLTSTSQSDLIEMGIERDIKEQVALLAERAAQAGLDGVVCSAQEAPMLRPLKQDFLLVTPGIRPKGSAVDDQQRICTPRQAIDDGVDYLVIGRPVTRAESPAQMLQRINNEIS